MQSGDFVKGTVNMHKETGCDKNVPSTGITGECFARITHPFNQRVTEHRKKGQTISP